MSKDLNPSCKKCRREGTKLFLKAEKCYTQKCPLIKRNYPPGIHGPAGKPRLTGYGLQLREKQKAKRIFGILEKQFKNYFLKSITQKGDTGNIFFQYLKSRFDNVVYETGLAKSRRQARQLISHGHFLINGKKVNIPSYQMAVNDKITIRKNSLEKKEFKNILEKIDKIEMPSWLYFDKKNLEAKVLEKPVYDPKSALFNVKQVIEFYSR